MNTRKKKATTTVSPVVVRLPKKLISSLDKAAAENCRSRSSEIRVRLVESLAAEGKS